MNIIDKIDQYLLQEHEHKARTSYYPSEVSKCMRQLYYKWTNTKASNPIEAGAIWKMRMGDSAHELIHDFLIGAGLEIINEVSFKYDIGLELPISGRIDNIFIDEDGEMAGIEVKSSYGAGIKNLQKSGKPKQSDLEQVIIYLQCNPSIKRFYLVYFGRDNAYRTQFVIERYPELEHDFKNLLQKFYGLKYFVDENKVPSREYQAAIKNGEIRDKFQKDNVEYKTEWQCRYCSHVNLCWKDEIEKYKTGDNSADFKAVADEM